MFSDKCYLPQSVGRCRSSQEKFFYNSATHQCETFVYGGCQGNDNKFDDITTCQEDCVKPQKPGQWQLVIGVVLIDNIYFLSILSFSNPW